MRVVTKAEAQSLGLTRFFTGIPCKRGHLSERRVRGGCCIQCGLENYSAWDARNPGVTRARHAAFRQNNPERVSAINAEWRKKNAARKKALDQAYYKANAAKVKAQAKAWNRAHPECKRVLCANRQAKIRGSDGRHTKAEIRSLLKRQKKKCAYCRAGLSGGYEIDHIMPVALGGGNGIHNIQLTCVPCNRRKSAKHPIKFAREIGLLI